VLFYPSPLYPSTTWLIRVPILTHPLLHRLSVVDPTLKKKDLKTLWTYVDADNSGVITLSGLHQMLEGKFGKHKKSRPATVVDRVIARVLERCGSAGGLKGLQRYCVMCGKSDVAGC